MCDPDCDPCMAVDAMDEHDYFLPETCPFCNATLASDGLHWASGRDDCNTGRPDDADWTPLASRDTDLTKETTDGHE